MGLSHVISRHLREGDKVRLRDWGLMKLEIESDKVDTPEAFRPGKHIKGVRLQQLVRRSFRRPHRVLFFFCAHTDAIDKIILALGFCLRSGGSFCIMHISIFYLVLLLLLQLVDIFEVLLAELVDGL